MQTRKYLGKWELGCLVFHLCITRLFTSLPGTITARSGSAAWLSALVSGIVFLSLLFLVLRFVKPPKNLSRRAVCVLSAIYWMFAAAALLKEGVSLLQQTAYFHSPDWFLILFLLLGAVVPPLCGGRSVYRMHSLLVPLVAVSLFVIALFGFSGARFSHLSPCLGDGTASILGGSFSSILFYLDLPFLALLLPRCRPEVSVRKTVFFSATAAVAFHLGFMLIASLRHPYEMDIATPSPLYAMAETGVSTEALFLFAFLISMMLYLGLALFLIAGSIRDIKKGFGKRQAAMLLVLLLCLPLSGCYDSREVEETAYLIGLGIDKGDTAFRYTFQISNPLEMGKTSQKEGEESTPVQQEDTNKGVNNMTIEAENLYLALSQLRSYLGKEPNLSHLKVITFSKELARNSLLPHAETLLSHQEIRPDTNLCLAESAESFLTKVKPSLEQSTARYYELMFWRRYSPYAPVTELKDFVSACLDSGSDPVLPLAEGEQIAGMGIFRDGTLVLEADAEKAMLYKLLSGKGSDITVSAGKSVFSVTSRQPSHILVNLHTSVPEITVKPVIHASLLHGSANDYSLLAASLESGMTALLRTSASLSSDILALGTACRTSFPTQTEWQAVNWRSQLEKASIFTKSTLNLEK